MTVQTRIVNSEDYDDCCDVLRWLHEIGIQTIFPDVEITGSSAEPVPLFIIIAPSGESHYVDTGTTLIYDPRANMLEIHQPEPQPILIPIEIRV